MSALFVYVAIRILWTYIFQLPYSKFKRSGDSQISMRISMEAEPSYRLQESSDKGCYGFLKTLPMLWVIVVASMGTECYAPKSQLLLSLMAISLGAFYFTFTGTVLSLYTDITSVIQGEKLTKSR